MLSLCLTASLFLSAKVSSDEASQLGESLTPMGAEMSGNAEGTIPAWNGGITKPTLDYKKGDHHPDPFGTDKVLFRIQKSNIKNHDQCHRSIIRVCFFYTGSKFS